jgi:hypothetical protein
LPIALDLWRRSRASSNQVQVADGRSATPIDGQEF